MGALPDNDVHLESLANSGVGGQPKNSPKMGNCFSGSRPSQMEIRLITTLWIPPTLIVTVATSAGECQIGDPLVTACVDRYDMVNLPELVIL